MQEKKTCVVTLTEGLSSRFTAPLLELCLYQFKSWEQFASASSVSSSSSEQSSPDLEGQVFIPKRRVLLHGYKVDSE
jgi:hypothetical protein